MNSTGQHGFQTEQLTAGHEWLRIADPQWDDPVDATFSAQVGGRWNPPDSFATLYLNEDVVTARLNLRSWADRWPFEPEELRAEHAPVLVAATLPDEQTVADAHTPSGLDRLGLPPTYPADAAGELIDHSTCQAIGKRLRDHGLDGVRCRSAQTPLGAGRELAWFPEADERAIATSRMIFDEWFWG